MSGNQSRVPPIAAYKNQQRYIFHRGQSHHFVSYEGTSANPRKSLPATAPMWCLIRAGKRWNVMEQQLGMSDEETDRTLREWLESQNFPAESGRSAFDAGSTSRWDRRWQE